MRLLHASTRGCAVLLALAAAATAAGWSQVTSSPSPKTGNSHAAPALLHLPTPSLPSPIPPRVIAGNEAQGEILTSPLKITLTPSETPLKLGSNSNIAADIQNVSNLPVVVDTGSIQLMTHAILSTTASLCAIPLSASGNTSLAGPVTLEPEDHLNLFFNLSETPYSTNQLASLQEDFAAISAATPAGSTSTASTDPATRVSLIAAERKYQNDLSSYSEENCSPNLYERLKRKIDFAPGSYDYFVSGKFAICEPDGTCAIPNRSFAQSAMFPVGIDQTLIIAFAIIGGLLAYLVVSVRGSDGALGEFFTLITADDSERKGIANVTTKRGQVLILTLKIFRDMIGVAILAAAFTIVTSRLSDSQFPIKISVLDVWGAITVGFLSYFAGNKFIDSLHDLIK